MVVPRLKPTILSSTSAMRQNSESVSNRSSTSACSQNRKRFGDRRSPKTRSPSSYTSLMSSIIISRTTTLALRFFFAADAEGVGVCWSSVLCVLDESSTTPRRREDRRGLLLRSCGGGDDVDVIDNELLEAAIVVYIKCFFFFFRLREIRINGTRVRGWRRSTGAGGGGGPPGPRRPRAAAALPAATR